MSPRRSDFRVDAGASPAIAPPFTTRRAHSRSPCCALAIAASTASAQKLQFRQLTPDDGLSSSLVQAILQDSRGFVWLGTQKGLNRYDGYGFAIYRHRAGDSTSVADNNAMTLYEDAQKTLWVGTPAGSQPLRPRARRLRELPRRARRHRRRRAPILEAQGTLYLGTARGLYKFDRATRQGDAHPPSSSPGFDDPGTVRGQPKHLWIGRQGQRRARARSADRIAEGLDDRSGELRLADALPGEGRAPVRRGRRGRHLHGA